jgi:HEAT repeat protein
MLDNVSIDVLIQALQDSSSEVRAQAAALLRKKPDIGAVEALITALSDTSAAVRDYAASALGAIGDAKAVEPLIELIFDPKDHVRQKAQAALILIGTASVEPLLRLLDTIDLKPEWKDVKRKWDVVDILRGIGDTRAVDTLLRMLATAIENGDNAGGNALVSALEHLDDTRAVMPLIAILKDETAPSRPESAGTLGVLKDVRAVQPLIDCLQDKDVFVRHRAAWALGNIGDIRAVKPLIAALADTATLFDKQVEEGAPEVVIRALKKFERLGSLIPPVPVCDVAGEALQKIGTPEALEAVKSWQKTQQR